MQALQIGNINASNVLLNAEANLNIIDKDSDTCLHRAVRGWCNKEILQSVIRCCANVNATNKSSVTALRLAYQMGNKDAISELLKAEADPNIVDEVGETCLHTAIRSKCSSNNLKALITHRADVNVTNKNSVTALRLACQTGNEDAVSELLKAGADPNIVDEAGETCLHTAIRSKCSPNNLEALITHFADVNATNKNSETALRLAVQMKHSDAIIVLLEAGADSNIEDKKDYTYLRKVVGNMFYEGMLYHAIRYHNRGMNAATNITSTALRVTCQLGDVAVISILLQTGVDFHTVDDRDVDGDTCLHKAVRYNCNSEVLQAIINPSIVSDSVIHSAVRDYDEHLSDFILRKWEHLRWKKWHRNGGYVNTTNKHNETALVLVCEKGNTDAINVLLDAGADHNISDELGETWIHHVIDGTCKKETIQIMIEHGADVNAMNKHDETALMRACTKGHIGTINILLSVGADPNVADTDGNTCLHIALRHSYSKEDLQAIIGHGAQVDATKKLDEATFEAASEKKTVGAVNVRLNTTNKNHQTAYMLACDQGNTDAMSALVNAGADPSFRFYVYTARHLSR